MKISLIVAVGPNGEIGRGGELPWPKLPSDMKWFARQTRGKPLIMGRKTWDSLPLGPLPGRHNIVLTRDAPAFWRRVEAEALALDSEWVWTAHNLNHAIYLAGYAEPDAPKPEEAVVIGGGHVYQEALPRVDTVYLTKVDPIGENGFPGYDRFFPYPLAVDEWGRGQQHGKWHVEADGKVRVGFYVYDRKSGRSEGM